MARRTAEGKTQREVRRCLKRAIARQLYRLLEGASRSRTTNTPSKACLPVSGGAVSQQRSLAHGVAARVNAS